MKKKSYIGYVGKNWNTKENFGYIDGVFSFMPDMYQKLDKSYKGELKARLTIEILEEV